jgi:radical SAM superfamily enzyme YgiQ (UPF0313 family)
MMSRCLEGQKGRMGREFVRKAQERLAREQGAVTKEWGGHASIALVFPNTYHVGMSNLGFQTIYRALNARPDLVCERAFLPDAEDLAEHERRGTPVLSLESQRPLGEFDCLAFSVAYENDYLNLLRILALSGIPIRARDRYVHHPLVSLGGICAWSNPEPLVPFLDWVFLGEGEALGPEVFGQWRETRDRVRDLGAARAEFLRALLEIEGVYRPDCYEVKEHEDGTVAEVVAHEGAPLPVPKRIVARPDEIQTMTAVRTQDTEFAGMHLVEVGRGCGRGCRFCLEGEIYRPVRHRHLPALMAAVAGLAPGDRVGLVGACITDYPGVQELLAGRRARRLDVSLSSLRADRLSADLLQALKEGGARTITLAPEAGTERLRDRLGKGLTDEEILTAAERVAEAELRGLKLYFMIGLPDETAEDVAAIPRLAKAARHRMLARRRNPERAPEVTAGVSCFVPKPWTAFQWCPMADVKSLDASLALLRREFRRAGIHLTHDVPKWAHLQGVLARGDRHAAELLALALAHKGDWRQAFREWPRNGDFYACRPRPLDERFPWDHLEVGARRDRLVAEYREATAADPGA